MQNRLKMLFFRIMLLGCVNMYQSFDYPENLLPGITYYLLSLFCAYHIVRVHGDRKGWKIILDESISIFLVAFALYPFSEFIHFGNVYLWMGIILLLYFMSKRIGNPGIENRISGDYSIGKNRQSVAFYLKEVNHFSTDRKMNKPVDCSTVDI